MRTNDKTVIFEQYPIFKALMVMSVPTVISQLITLVYNIADTWYIGRTNDPYMVAACSLTATVYLMITAISSLFGIGGGNLVVQLLGKKDHEEARRAASRSLTLSALFALVFSVLCLIFMKPLLLFLGAGENTYEYARQYLMVVVVLGGVPTVISNTMCNMLRNVGHAKEASFGLSMGGAINIVLDPLFMFVLLPNGQQVLGAAIATFLSNVISTVYYILIYRRVTGTTVLELPKRLERVRPDSSKAILSIGLPAALSLAFYDLCNVVINMLSASHSDFDLAAIGIVLKAERLPLNIGIGICMGMTPLIAYSYASQNHKRMQSFFNEARKVGIAVAVVSVALYYAFAGILMRAFISDPETIRLGTSFLRARCFATPFMFLSFNMVHYMQSVRRGGISFLLAFVRQIVLNIPILFLMNSIFGMNGVVWTQLIADIINVIVSYILYYKARPGILKEAGA